MLKPDVPVLNQVERIITTVRRGSGDIYMPQAVEALEKLAENEHV